MNRHLKLDYTHWTTSVSWNKWL